MDAPPVAASKPAGISHDAAARLLDLPPLETQAVVLLGSLAVGINVYLMARQFDVMQGPVASAMVMSTTLSALTTPLAVALAGH